MEVRADLHVHTAHSTDGRESVKRIVHQAKKVGLGALAITDHNVISGWNTAIEAGKKEGIIIIRGEEISSSEGHILAYGIQERIKKGLSAEETVDRILEQGGLAVAAHPFRRSNGVGEAVVRNLDFDAVEALNSRSHTRANDRAVSLARSLGLPVTAGSDAHTLAEIGAAYTIFADVESEEDILGEIKRGNTELGGSSQSTWTLASQGCKKIKAWAGRGFKRI